MAVQVCAEVRFRAKFEKRIHISKSAEGKLLARAHTKNGSRAIQYVVDITCLYLFVISCF